VTAHATFPGLLRSEWIKLWSLRSAWWCFGIAIVLIAGIAALAAGAIGSFAGDATGAAAASLAVQGSTVGTTVGELVFAVLGVLVISGEYSTGQIRSTFAAAPKRSGALAAKVLLFGVVSFIVGAVAIGLSAGVSLLELPEAIRSTATGDAGYWLALLGAVGSLALCGVLSVLVGAIVRSVPAGIAIVVGLFFVVPVVLSIVGAITRQTWPSNLAAILPAGAASAMSSYNNPSNVYNDFSGDALWSFLPWQGLAIFAGWVVLLWIAAEILTRHRDV